MPHELHMPGTRRAGLQDAGAAPRAQAMESTTAAGVAPPLRVAYLVNQYPKVSHSFIRREILALERQGIEVLRLALRGRDAELADAQDEEERTRTRYMLEGGALPLAVALMGEAARSPRRFAAALCLAARLGWRADRPLAVHFVYLAEACRVARLLRVHGARHLHAHFGTNSATVAMLAGMLAGTPFSFTAHGPDEFDQPAFIALPEKIRRAHFVVAVSAFGRSQLARWSDPAHWDRIKIVHCGLERAFHDVARAGGCADRRFVCVGRLSAQKGQMLLVEAAAELCRRGTHFELVLAGDGEMRGAIEAQVARLALGGHVRITGWISSAGVRREIQAARALVLPSFAEGLPVVIMEAMALRRPVLATYVAGIPELVRAGETGWLFPAGSVEALADAMQACLDASPAVLEAMGEAARRRALERHDIDREAARLAAHFRESAAGRVERRA